jgi:hypothetical protein
MATKSKSTTTKATPIHRYAYPHLSAAVAHIDATPRTWLDKASESDSAEQSWDLGAGWAGARQMCLTGWQEGIDAMTATLGNLPAPETSPARQYRVVGSRVSAPRAAAGSMRCMVAKKPDNGARPMLTLYVDVCASSFVNADCAARYGAAIVRYVEQLEARGYRIALHVGFAVNLDTKGKHDQTHFFTWQLKDHGTRLCLPDAAFSIAHLGCFRRIGFALIERSNSKTTYGYGSIQRLTPALVGDPKALCLTGINAVNSTCTTDSDALAHVAAVIGEHIAK